MDKFNEFIDTLDGSKKEAALLIKYDFIKFLGKSKTKNFHGEYEYSGEQYSKKELEAIIGAVAEDIRGDWSYGVNGRCNLIKDLARAMNRDDLCEELDALWEDVWDIDGRIMRDFSIYGSSDLRKLCEENDPKWDEWRYLVDGRRY